MTRSSWKGPLTFSKFLPQNVGTERLKSVEKRKLDLITYNRSSVIINEWIGLNIGVHNGKSFIPVYIVSPMVGHKLGEFARTRLKPVHPKKNDRSAANKGGKGGLKKK